MRYVSSSIGRTGATDPELSHNGLGCLPETCLSVRPSGVEAERDDLWRVQRCEALLPLQRCGGFVVLTDVACLRCPSGLVVGSMTVTPRESRRNGPCAT